jgi:hypothetical protein
MLASHLKFCPDPINHSSIMRARYAQSTGTKKPAQLMLKQVPVLRRLALAVFITRPQAESNRRMDKPSQTRLYRQEKNPVLQR